MKKKEFERIGKHLLGDLPGFTVKGDLLFVQPVGHTLRAVCFNGSLEPRGFYGEVFFQPLFVPSNHIGFSCGWRLEESRLWNADDPNLLSDLAVAIKREALPFLSRIQTPRDTAEAALSLNKSGDPIVQQAIGFAFARAGDAEKAADALEQFVELASKTGYWREEIARATRLETQLLTNPGDAQRQLDAWERETAENLDLDRLR